jgi:undecaprenyl diphosphate synthase
MVYTSHPESMSSRTFPDAQPLHVAIIMDGNGRWATQRAMPRAAGHRVGVDVVRRIVEHAPSLGIGTLTLYAFSSDNWRRPPSEVNTLMRLFRSRLVAEVPKLLANNVRLTAIGRRDRLPLALGDALGDAEEATARGTTLHLRLAIDYSARDEILRAAQRIAAAAEPTREEFGRILGGERHANPAPDVDLVIRTGGERRLSDFLLWESAYAELYFTDVMWPDFGAKDLETAVAYFQERDRRFGALSAAG